MIGKLRIIFWFFLGISATAGAQVTEVTLPFSLETRLLVFNGKINGQDVKLAFDTGASAGVAYDALFKATQMQPMNTQHRIEDGNGQVTSLPIALIDSMEIGGLVIKDVRSYLADMPYLACMNLYLLGGNVIRQFHWSFDFDKQEVTVSKQPFAVPASARKLSVTYRFNTPHINLQVGKSVIKDVLIDMGYTGSLILPAKKKGVSRIIAQKAGNGLVQESLSGTFALFGAAPPVLEKTLRFDSLLIGGRVFYGVTADCQEKADVKLGLSFFATQATHLIINHQESAFYVVPREVPLKEQRVFACTIGWAKGKMDIISKQLHTGMPTDALAIGDQVLAVDGRSAESFADECAFLTWYYLTVGTQNAYRITLADGRELTVERIAEKQ